MIGLRARAPLSAPLATALVIAPLALIAAWASIVLSGTRFGAVLALGAVGGPIALYTALAAPLIFPFGVFVAAVPFDNLLAVASFGTLTKALGALSGIAILLRLVRSRAFVPPDRSLAAWIPFITFAIASFTWARDPTRGVAEATTIAELFLLYAVVSFATLDRRTLYFVLGAVLVGADVAGGYGAYLFHRGLDISSGRLFIGSGGGGSTIDPNHFAAAMLLPLTLALVGFTEARSWIVRVMCGVTLLLAGIGVSVSGSRGAIVALGAAFLYLLLRSRKRLFLAGLALGAVAVGVGLFGDIVQRFNDAAATGGAGRLGIWKVALAAFSAHPIVGSGIGNFTLAYDDAYLTVPAFAKMKIVESAHWSVAPHNNLVWIGVELGALGLAAFLYAWWHQLRILRNVDDAGEFGPLRRALEAAMIAQFVASLFLGTLTYKYLWLAFMLAALVRNAATVPRRWRR